MLSSSRATRGMRISATRALFSRASASPQLPLNAVFPTLPSTHPLPAHVGEVTTSTTKKGVKLASDTSAAFASTLGVELAAGSRTETEANAGISLLAAKMAFRATIARSDLRLYRDVEAIGGVLHKTAGRDFVRYGISVLPDKLEKAAAILAETTLAPRFAMWDITEVKTRVQVDAEILAENGQQSVLDALHAAAFYEDQTLGRPTVTTENLEAFDTDALHAFHAQYVNTAGLALVGSGIEHDLLKAIANDWFRDLPVVSSPMKTTEAKYVGGEVRLKQPREHTIVALGFPTVGRRNASHGAAKVLQAMLTRRLKSKHAQAFLCSYDEIGLVGYIGEAAPHEAGTMVDAFLTQLKTLVSTPPTKEELEVAKIDAAFAGISELSTRAGRIASLGKVAMAQEQAKTPVDLVNHVSATDVQALAKQALTSRPSLASIGKLATVPHLDAIAEKLREPKKESVKG